MHERKAPASSGAKETWPAGGGWAAYRQTGPATWAAPGDAHQNSWGKGDGEPAKKHRDAKNGGDDKGCDRSPEAAASLRRRSNERSDKDSRRQKKKTENSLRGRSGTSKPRRSPNKKDKHRSKGRGSSAKDDSVEEKGTCPGGTEVGQVGRQLWQLQR